MESTASRLPKEHSTHRVVSQTPTHIAMLLKIKGSFAIGTLIPLCPHKSNMCTCFPDTCSVVEYASFSDHILFVGHPQHGQRYT